MSLVPLLPCLRTPFLHSPLKHSASLSLAQARCSEAALAWARVGLTSSRPHLGVAQRGRLSPMGGKGDPCQGIQDHLELTIWQSRFSGFLPSLPPPLFLETRFTMSQTVVLKVGMSCEGCSGAVKRVLGKMEGVESFDIDMKEQKVTVKGNVQPDAVLKTVSKTGKKTTFWDAEAPAEPEAKPAEATAAV
ncbi:hypothetical protein NL676_037411 [Syzygium grande]|nr:hypothetical protein NL676_037411 [Syzygium grande]